MPQRSSEFSTPADIQACRAMLSNGSRSFAAASRLLPRDVCESAISLYAFCRVADDVIDAAGADSSALASLQLRLERAYAGAPVDLPEDRALADLVARFGIPRALPEALLEGFAWDAAGRRYETLSEVTDYAVRVAGSVGAMMAMLMGAKDPDVVSRACDLGVAMQFSNIARDVGEDARNGRLYLPRAWLREVGVDPDKWLANPVFSPQIASVVQRLLDVADGLYARAEEGIARLPLACRPGIGAARFLYAEIGRQVERIGLDSVSSRAVVSGRRKLLVLARSLAATALPAGWTAVEPLPEALYLINAVAAVAPELDAADRIMPWTYIDTRISGVLGMFERLAFRAEANAGP